MPTNPLLSLKRPIGFGLWLASWPDSPIVELPEAREQYLSALHLAMDAGVRLFDTADIYAPSWDSMGHNEVILADAVESWSGSANDKSELILATKGGITRGPGEAWSKDASYGYLMAAIEKSANNLRVNEIDLWQHHRLDFNLTLGEQLSNLKKVLANAPIKHIGVSNYSAGQLRAALDVLGGPSDGGIISVQNQLNPAYRQELDVLAVCEEHGLAYLPWSPMNGVKPADADTDIYKIFAALAKDKGVSVFAIAQAWSRSLSPNLIPLPGATKASSIMDTLSAVDLRLSESDLAKLASLPASLPLHEELVRHQPLPE